MPASFSILDPEQSLESSLLLEASAGTGKTFAIENLIVRLLIEGEKPPTLDEILVVTFTRASTRELSTRIYRTLSSASEHVQHFERSGLWPKEAVDYLRVLESRGEELLWRTKQRLSQALANFQSARIYTIHSFCWRMLQECSTDAIGAQGGLEPLPLSRRLQLVRDFYRTELSSEWIAPVQLELLLKEHRSDQDSLQRALATTMSRPQPIQAGLDRQALEEELQALCGKLPLPRLADEIERVAPGYNKLCDRSGERKLEVQLALDHLRAEPDLETHLRFTLPLLEKLSAENLKKRSKIDTDSLHVTQAREQLLPLLQRAADPAELFSLLAARCQAFYRHRQKLEGWIEPDDLLLSVDSALSDSKFIQAIRERLSVAVIDEFQDTDPVQWRIFEVLFCDTPGGRLFLVGDPKQSIYAFRQADIYTYLRARERVPEHRTLATNYRSTPELMNTLNALFDEELCPGWIPLPRQRAHLPYQPVSAARDAAGSGPAVTWMLGSGKARRGGAWPTQELEQQLFFSAIASEVQRLDSPLRDVAVLVRDRFQADRLHSYFQKHGIPSVVRRAESLVSSPLFGALQDLLRAVLHPRSRSDLSVALGGPILRWTAEELTRLEDARVLESVLQRFYLWRSVLIEQGFAAFIDRALREALPDHSCAERLLWHAEEGPYQLACLKQLAALLIDHQSATQCSAEMLLGYFRQLQQWHEDQDERILVRQDSSSEAVQIMTMHISKGLEFDVVFALGLVTRTKQRDLLIPDNDRLYAFDESSERSRSFLDELDAEKSRQLYVAMTRAKSKLYLPALFTVGRTIEVKRGEASPMELYLARAGQPISDTNEVYERIPNLEQTTVRELLERGLRGQSVSFMELPVDEPVKILPKEMQAARLNAPPVPRNSFAPLQLHSFSSLTARLPKPSPQIPAEVDLPAGADTGTVLHHLIEGVVQYGPADWMEQEDALSWVSERLRGRMRGFVEPLSEHLLHAVTVPLEGLRMSLIELPKDALRSEVEFLYHNSDGEPVKGFIDLVVQGPNGWLVVDWKSHWLEDYTASSVQEAMESHYYHLQAQLYLGALRRWLGPEATIHGALYVFLRGLPSAGQLLLSEEAMACL